MRKKKEVVRSAQHYLNADEESEVGKQAGLVQIIRILSFVLLSIAAFYLMESYEHNPFVKVRPEAQIFNILLFELIGWGLYFIVGGLCAAIRIELVLAMVFGLVNHYVMLFRSTPFVPWDIYSIGTAVHVADNYDFAPGARVLLVTAAFVALFVLAQFLREDKKMRLRYRGAGAVVTLALMCLFTNALQSEQFQLRHNLYPYLFTPVYMTEVNGMAVTFAMNLQYLVIEKPDGYDGKKAQELLAQYESGYMEQDGTEQYPNIIVIMDEAFSDLSVLGSFETNVDYMPFVHELQAGADNTVTGSVQVSVCGGNTANSEFEFLTGNTMAYLPDGSIPYQQYLKEETPSLASHLAALGYETYAQHPYYASGWERNKVYPLLGFAYMDFLDAYAPKRYVRKYISDACDFAHVIETYENKTPGTPAFIFNVTMQNHGGYTEQSDNFTSDVSAGLGSDALDQYLSLLRLSDESLRNLVEYFAGVDEPTILVFFGDHQPNDFVVQKIWKVNGIDPSKLTEEQRLARYQVPYLIWANYDIPESSGVDTSLNYLGAQLLRIAGVPTSAYQNYLLELRQTYPCISAAGEPEDVPDTYEYLQYYMLFDNTRGKR